MLTIRKLILAVILLLPTVAALGQTAYWTPQSPNSDTGVGVAVTTDGRIVYFNKLVITKVDTPPPVVNKVTKATYVYDKDTAPIPPQVAAALSKINTNGSGILGDQFEVDNVTGLGTVPKQFEKQLAAAKADKDGLPALVVMSGDTVLKVVHDPKTAKEVEDALK